jgi:very-short-patch-repair endonuclease/predicted transcriptional regulator of viral defense system
MDPKRSTDPGRGPDFEIAELAKRQHGVVARRHLAAAGLSDERIKSRIRRGQLHRIHRGVYAVGYARLTIEARWMAATLACGSGAVLSHRSAGRLWRLLRTSGAPIEVTRSAGWRPPSGIVVHRSPMRHDERDVVDAIPVTGVSRTLLDLAAVVSKRQLERAMNEAEVLRLTDVVSLSDLLERYPRRPGTVALRAILADENAMSGPTVNDFEEAFAGLIDEYALPWPRFNADLFVRGRHVNADCLWQEARLIVELDGGAVHRTPRAFEEDRERDRVLTAEGWKVIRVTWRQLRDDPAGVIDDVRLALRRPGAAPPTL